MSFTIQKEINSIYDFQFWGGAVARIEMVKETGKEEELFDHLTAVFGDDAETPTETQINDYVWFEEEVWATAIGIYDAKQVAQSIQFQEDYVESIPFLKERFKVVVAPTFLDFVSKLDVDDKTELAEMLSVSHDATDMEFVDVLEAKSFEDAYDILETIDSTLAIQVFDTLIDKVFEKNINLSTDDLSEMVNELGLDF